MASIRVTAADVAAIGIFANLAPEVLEECAGLAMRRSLPVRQTVFSQGEPCIRFHALLSGAIRIAQAGRDGGLALLRFVGPGEPFGSLGMFVDGCYPAEATAVEASVELSWSQTHFRQLAARHSGIAINLVGLAARRLAEIQERLRETMTLPAEQRIAHALLRLSRVHAHELSDGRLEITWSMKRKDVAAISATSLYTVSRVMTRWEREGIIASAGKRITINSVARLDRIAESAA